MYAIRLLHPAAMPHKLHCENEDCEHINTSIRQLVWPVEVQYQGWLVSHRKPNQFWCYACVKHAPRDGGGNSDLKPDLSLKWPCRVQVVHYQHEMKSGACECLEHEPTLKILKEHEMPTTSVVTQYISAETGTLVQSVNEYWCQVCVQRAQSDEDRQYVVA